MGLFTALCCGLLNDLGFSLVKIPIDPQLQASTGGLSALTNVVGGVRLTPVRHRLAAGIRGKIHS